jgi:hypothetical protein
MTGRMSKVEKDQNIEKAIRMLKIEKIRTTTNLSANLCKCYKFGELVKYFWENIMVIILNILVILLNILVILLKILRGGQNDDWQNVKS